MIRKVASHYIFWHRLYKLHYIELDENGIFRGIYPLKEEIGNTEFYNGILILSCFKATGLVSLQACFEKGEPLPYDICLSRNLDRIGYSKGVEVGSRINLLLLEGVRLTAPEFSTNHGCCNGYIKRL